ncbi:hypothetical protein F4802DRAFT_598941 [Xylaria palmicola]|nr:hypothetical protein F4802DRAFT_598941 [Xylaria palmicola]
MANQITASDIMAVAKIQESFETKPIVDWEKLAAKAGFKDGATAQAHYEPLLDPDRPDDAARKRHTSYNTTASPKQVKADPYNLSNFEDGEA